MLALAAWLAWKFYGHLEAKMLEKTAPGPGAATISAWDIIAHSAFRIFILSVVVGFSTYCLRVARAYMHMSELNQHRQRVAQSLVGLVQAAASRQVRDALVVDLVQSIVAFGNSGLIPGDDDTIGAQRTELSSLLIRQLAKPGSGGG